LNHLFSQDYPKVTCHPFPLRCVFRSLKLKIRSGKTEVAPPFRLSLHSNAPAFLIHRKQARVNALCQQIACVNPRAYFMWVSSLSIRPGRIPPVPIFHIYWPMHLSFAIEAGHYFNDLNEFPFLSFMNNFPRLVGFVIKRFFQQNRAVFYACYYRSKAYNISNFKLIYLP
jgi:hypothetical protein